MDHVGKIVQGVVAFFCAMLSAMLSRTWNGFPLGSGWGGVSGCGGQKS